MEKHFLICWDQDIKISNNVSEAQFYLEKLLLTWSFILLLFYILYHPFLSHPRVLPTSACPHGQWPLLGPAAHLEKPQVLICTFSTAQSSLSQSGESREEILTLPRSQTSDRYLEHSQQIPLPANTTKSGIAKCTPAAPRIAQLDVVWKLWQHQPLWQALFETKGLAFCYQGKPFLGQKDLLKMPRKMPACILQFLSHWDIFQKSCTLRVEIHTTYLEKYNQYKWIFSNILVAVFSALSIYFTISITNV